MDGYLIAYDQEEFALPVLLGWDLSHGMGTPADAFEVSFIYDASMGEALSKAARFRAVHGGETVFYGVVDEYEVTLGQGGLTAKVSGRGLQALLLDNEAEAAEYYGASLDFILARHALPWGVTSVRANYFVLPGLFTVASGSSQWRVLQDFAFFGGGVRPRFTRDGVLLLNGETGKALKIDWESPVLRARYSERRYGVVSQALVKNKAARISTVADNRAFQARGGLCRRVINMPRTTYYDALRHTGEYQIVRSAEGSRSCTITLPQLFAAVAGDTVSLSSEKLGLTGNFDVFESRCFADGSEAGTELTLYQKD